MQENKEDVKSELHERNTHRQSYDFPELIIKNPDLKSHVFKNEFNNLTINFFDPEAVKQLNKALLMHHYGIQFWDIPPFYLCPPIPGRADYLHNMADLLYQRNRFLFKSPILHPEIKVLDIGVGASLIYPILGNHAYGWSFIGTDIDTQALESSKKIAEKNPHLSRHIELRQQPDSNQILLGVMNARERWDMTICNPPFYASAEAAAEESIRKNRNLKRSPKQKPELNFGGKGHELWYSGGEVSFILKLIAESKEYADQCYWFSSLVAKEDHLPPLQDALKKIKARKVKVIEMSQGNKRSRFIAWTFLTDQQQKEWELARIPFKTL